MSFVPSRVCRLHAFLTSPDKINRTNFEISVFVGRAFFNVGLSGEGKYDEHFLLIGVLVKTIHFNIVERAGSENLDLKICSVNFVRTWPTCTCYFLALQMFWLFGGGYLGNCCSGTRSHTPTYWKPLHERQHVSKSGRFIWKLQQLPSSLPTFTHGSNVFAGFHSG